VLCSAVQCSAVQCSAVQCSAVQSPGRAEGENGSMPGGPCVQQIDDGRRKEGWMYL
jgi:hypothetical protein